MQIGRPRRDSLFHFGIVIAALAAVPLLMAPLVYQQARMRAEGEAAVTSVAILRQLDTLLGVVSDSLDKSQEAVGKPCREVLGRLTRMTMLSPYFRSLVLVERENVYCSSLRGELHDLPLQVAFKALGSLPAGQRITPSNATPQVPERASVIMSRGDENGSGVLAIIDGQYLLDIQQAASYDERFQVQMVLRQSQRQLPGGAPATGDGVAVAASARFPVEVRVAVAPALASAYRADAWRHYAPFILLAALLAGYLRTCSAVAGCRWSATCIGPCAPVSSTWSTSRSSTSIPESAGASRRWCAGSGRTGVRCGRTSSSPWPKTTA